MHHHVHNHISEGSHFIAGVSTLSFLKGDFVSFVLIVSFSFFSSLHCLGMCGPIVCLKLGASSKNTRMNKIKELLYYNSGRLISYTGLCMLLGYLGSFARIEYEKTTHIWAYGLGGVFLLLGLLPKSRMIFSRFRDHFLFRVKSFQNAGLVFFIIGLSTVFLPCMTLTPVLGLAALSKSPLTGAIIGFGFFIGTVPAISAAKMLSLLQLPTAWRLYSKKLSYLFFILAGFVTISRVFH